MDGTAEGLDAESGRLPRFLIAHAAAGFMLALGVVAALFAGDVSGLRGLVLEVRGGLLAAAVFTLLMGQTLAVVQIAFALWLLAGTPGDGGGGHRGRLRPSGILTRAAPGP
ncbi:hypothetical protein P7L74_02870 (plasmid) [Tistrella mobilis]|uniref:hypothetical protein n=1 Tax=Tistrella mobilis TaxID=171437 RepID=UPI003556D2E1